MRTLGWLWHPVCVEHDPGQWHPECPQRIGAVDDALGAAGLRDSLHVIEAPLATREHIERVHEVDYVSGVLAAAPAKGLVQLDEDTSIGPRSVEAALRAAGAVVHAVDLVAAGDLDAAYCNVRPPGHHATRARTMGFCLFGNIAIGVAHALAVRGFERVAVIDFDVHHGNGTEDLLLDEPRALLCNSFQSPLYPYTGTDTHSDHIVNVPLPAGTDGAGFREAVGAAWFERLAAFQPQLVFFSAGFDAHLEDPLANLRLRAEDFAWITREVLHVTRASAAGRAISALEGGYALGALGRSAVAHVRALLDG